MNKYILTGSLFALATITCDWIAALVTWLYLDDVQCSFAQVLCNGWYYTKYQITHKITTQLIWYIGLHGFTGSILWYLEEEYLADFLKKAIGWIHNIFGPLLVVVISFIVMTSLENLLGIQEIFELIYNTLH
jgi:hypothetical protein